jgi:6-phosphogluconolactonase
VAAFEVGPGGSLKPMNEAATGGAGPCHVSIDPMGNNLLVSNYDGGNVASIRIRSDGAVGEKVAQMNFTGRGPDPKRQTKPYGHYAQVSPDGAWLYACDLGTDSVWFYPYDCTTGAIGSEETTLPGKVLPGSGPRHFVFNRDASRLYVVNEMGRSITTFTRDASTGSLHPLETVMALPPNTPAEGVTSAGIALHPSGHWLYVSNRGCDMLSVLAIDPQSGQLTLRESIPSVVVMPRHFTLDPSGLFLIAAGQKDGRIALFTIDPETGLLTATNQTATAPGAICVVSAR